MDKTIIDFINSHQGSLELTPEEAKQVLAADIYNDIPENIANIIDDILKIEKRAKIKVGNEGSRVLYVSFYAPDDFNDFTAESIKALGFKYKADEASFEKIGCACNMVLFTVRLWWD